MVVTASSLLKGDCKEVVKAGVNSDVQSFNAKINAAADLIDLVFSELYGCKPASHISFRDVDAEVVAKRQWVLALVENNINSMVYINRGLTMARKDKSPYFPSIGQFIDWCKNMNIADNIPTVEEAYLEAAQNSHNPNGFKFSHNIVFAAGKKTGWRYLLETPKKEAFSLFKRNYDVLIRGLDDKGCLALEFEKESNDSGAESKPFVRNVVLASECLTKIRSILG